MSADLGTIISHVSPDARPFILAHIQDKNEVSLDLINTTINDCFERGSYFPIRLFTDVKGVDIDSVIKRFDEAKEYGLAAVVAHDHDKWFLAIRNYALAGRADKVLELAKAHASIPILIKEFEEQKLFGVIALLAMEDKQYEKAKRLFFEQKDFWQAGQAAEKLEQVDEAIQIYTKGKHFDQAIFLSEKDDNFERTYALMQSRAEETTIECSSCDSNSVFYARVEKYVGMAAFARQDGRSELVEECAKKAIELYCEFGDINHDKHDEAYFRAISIAINSEMHESAVDLIGKLNNNDLLDHFEGYLTEQNGEFSKSFEAYCGMAHIFMTDYLLSLRNERNTYSSFFEGITFFEQAKRVGQQCDADLIVIDEILCDFESAANATTEDSRKQANIYLHDLFFRLEIKPFGDNIKDYLEIHEED